MRISASQTLASGLGRIHALLAVSVFSTPFSSHEASVVADVADVADVDEALHRLVEVSLVQPSDVFGEIRLLEPVRQYALHKLRTQGLEEPTMARYVALMVDLANDAARNQWTPRAPEIWRWCFRRWPELLNAMTWSLDRGDPSTALDIVAALGRRLVAVGVSDPFVETTERALDHPASARRRTPVARMVGEGSPAIREELHRRSFRASAAEGSDLGGRGESS